MNDVKPHPSLMRLIWAVGGVLDAPAVMLEEAVSELERKHQAWVDDGEPLVAS